MRADFQQYYHLNLDGLGWDYSLMHAAVLVEQLPPQSRTFIALNERAAWGTTEFLLADVANSLRWLVWAKTKDGQKNRNKPEMIQPPGGEKRASKIEGAVTLSDVHYQIILNKPRKEVCISE